MPWNLGPRVGLLERFRRLEFLPQDSELLVHEPLPRTCDELSWWTARDKEVDLINLFLVLPITNMLTKISPKKIEQNKGGNNIVRLHVTN